VSITSGDFDADGYKDIAVLRRDSAITFCWSSKHNEEKPDIVCVFGGDHIYKMNIQQMVDFHLEKGALATVASVPAPSQEAGAFGVLQVDEEWRINNFLEKPKENVPTIPNEPNQVLASMGNYVFDWKYLKDYLIKDLKDEESKHDFGYDIITSMVSSGKVFAYNFMKNSIPDSHGRSKRYWRDVGTIESYWKTSMDLISVHPELDLYNPSWPILSTYTPSPPSKFVFSDLHSSRIGIATDSLVAEGVIISGGQINRSILSPSVRINSFSSVEESILFDGVDVGRYSRLKRVIVDKHVKIPPSTDIGLNLEEDRKRFYVSAEGIVVIPKNTVF
jgi:glucose-1-phosphate adenylyltransferase